jgi:hypothetical protein
LSIGTLTSIALPYSGKEEYSPKLADCPPSSVQIQQIQREGKTYKNMITKNLQKRS